MSLLQYLLKSFDIFIIPLLLGFLILQTYFFIWFKFYLASCLQNYSLRNENIILEGAFLQAAVLHIAHILRSFLSLLALYLPRVFQLQRRLSDLTVRSAVTLHLGPASPLYAQVHITHMLSQTCPELCPYVATAEPLRLPQYEVLPLPAP